MSGGTPSGEVASTALPAAAIPPSVASGADRDAFFRQGVRLILGRWTALQLAVESGWGGRQSQAKAVTLGDQIVDWFYLSKDLYPDELENLLDNAMTNNFNTELDDGSIEQVAEDLLNMYDDCKEYKFDRVLKLAASAQSNMNRSALASSQRVKTGNSDDEDDDEDDENDDEDGMDAMDEDTRGEGRDASAVTGAGGEGMDTWAGGDAERVATETGDQVSASGSQKGSEASRHQATCQVLTAEEIAEGWETVPAKGKRRGKN